MADESPARAVPAAAVEVLSSQLIHSGPIFSVVRETVRLPSGLEQALDFVRHGGAVAVAALDQDGRMVLVRQYRHATGETLLEVPAGRLEPGEDPERAARRELEEETGLRAQRWTFLTRFFAAPGFCSERLVLFLAEELSPAGSDRLAADQDEEIEVLRLEPRVVLERACDAKTLLAALWVERRQGSQDRPPRPH